MRSNDGRDRRLLLGAAVALVALRTLPAAFVPAALAQADNKPFKPEELDRILAPIALYPDALLSQVMMAATYPLEVVEAARWSKANPNLKGNDAVKAVSDKSWDVSVKSLVAFPQVLAQMDDHLDWTQKLGDAMLAQQEDVARSVQRLRAAAVDAGNLPSSKEATVKVEGSGEARTIVIEPADPQIVYVPAYNPAWAYGAWPHPAYPPVYYPPPPAYYGSALLRGFMWGVGLAAAGALFGGWHWHGHGGNYVNINVNRAVDIDRNFNAIRAPDGDWQHDPAHRKGVAYPNNSVRNRFGQARPGVEQRQAFRGQAGNGPGPGPSGRPGQGGPGRSRGGGQRGGGALGGVERGRQVDREGQRGRQQQQRTAPQPRTTGGGGNGPRGGGGGGRR